MVNDDISWARELASEALTAYGFTPPTELQLLKHRENVVFRFASEGVPYVVRVHRQGYHSDQELACELDFVRALHAEGVAVPQFLTAPDGRGFCVVGHDHPAGPHQVDVQVFLENHGNFGDERTAVAGTADLDPSEFHALGRLLGEVHQATERSQYTMAVSRDDWDLDGLIGEQPAWGDPLRLPEITGEARTVVHAAIGEIRAQLERYGTPSHRYGPIHADLTPENVLRTPEGLVLIDFDDFAAGWHLFDLATAVFFFSPHPRFPEYRAALFDGYERVRPLDEADHAAFPALLLARGLTYLGWAADRRGEPTAEWLATEVRPHIEALAAALLAARSPKISSGKETHMTDLITRRSRTIGQFSPLFYDEPLQLVSGQGVWLTDVHGQRFLDGYNNVPHVGHANARVLAALTEQSGRLNINSRYLNDRVVDYAERLLATFDAHLERVFFGNSGSEANELALRMSRQLSGNTGVLVSDHSYHGTTITLAELTTGLQTGMPLGAHVRPIRIPDLDTDPRDEATVLAAALAEIDTAIASLQEAGFGLAASLFDPVYSTEGMPRVPAGFHEGLVARVKRAGGFVIADEVQSGFGRTGTHMWGHQWANMTPDIVTLGKPMGNGHPMAATVTTREILEAFGSTNEFFNTFAGNPVSSAVGEAVLLEMEEKQLMVRARSLGGTALEALEGFAGQYDFIRGAKGVGMFLGLDFAVEGAPAPALAKRVVEDMKAQRVLISRIGRHSSVLKVRPPLAFSEQELPILLDALGNALARV